VKTERRLSKKLKIYCCILIAQFHSIQYCMISVLFVFCELLNTYILIPTWSWIKESFFLHPDVCVYRGERIRAISSRAPSSPLVVLWCLKLYFVRLVHIDSPFSGLRRGFWSPGSGKPKSKERGPGATHIVTFVCLLRAVDWWIRLFTCQAATRMYFWLWRGKTRAGKAELGENGLGNGFQNKQ